MPDNDLTVLPAAIANLINLRELDISKNSKRAFKGVGLVFVASKYFGPIMLKWGSIQVQSGYRWKKKQGIAVQIQKVNF